MKKSLKFAALFFAVLISFGCQSEEKSNNSSRPTPAPEPSQTPTLRSETTNKLDIPRLAGKTAEEIDKTFGTPQEVKSVENGAEYRLYKIAGQSKGLAVRFKRGKAWSFNLILDKPFPTSKEALKEVFNIDVGNSAPARDPKEPLSEKYQGVFGGVRFAKVFAKREQADKGFTFVLAEVGE